MLKTITRLVRGKRVDRVVLVVAVALALLGALAGGASAKTVWLCNPWTSPNPCLSSRTATAVTYTGETRHETIEPSVPPNAAPVDCFYVYPTVSEQVGPNANYAIEPAETQIAIDQASRFSQVCRVYAPIYPQETLKAIMEPQKLSEILKAYLGVRAAFEKYLKHYNDGRGIVLIGHSQGAAVLEQLIHGVIEPNASLRSRLVSAIVLGGNVEVPDGELVGGTFEKVPACQQQSETGCVIAYSSFLKEPPADSLFGRTEPSSGREVLCVNPTLSTQDGSAGELLPYASTTQMPGELAPPAPEASTPWVAEPGLASAQCEHQNGASWLQVTLSGMSQSVAEERAARHELPVESQPTWGLHVYDVNEALGNLVDTVAAEEQTYAK